MYTKLIVLINLSINCKLKKRIQKRQKNKMGASATKNKPKGVLGSATGYTYIECIA